VDRGPRARDHDWVSGAPHRVLVVDDEPFVLKIAQRVLERDGIEVFGAGTGEEALAVMVMKPELGLVLLDSQLPDMSGEQVLEAMRVRQLTIPVLLTSGFGSDLLPTPEDFANLRGFLPKPYPVAQLSARVRELLS
jgi:DNA-binding response OmpR family regulator